MYSRPAVACVETSISDSVSCEVSEAEALAVAPNSLSGDLNVENLESPFLLM